MLHTKDKILNTAEELFARQGYAGTSLRSIIHRARVNVAAVHYHFRSKEALLDAVILRRAAPVNQERLALLDACERAAGAGPLPLDTVLQALFFPAFRLAVESKRGPVFVRLMARVHAEGETLPTILQKNFGVVLDRFIRAFGRALPDVPREQLLLGIHFSIGAMVQALRGPKLLEALSGGACRFDWQTMAARLVEYVSAGLRAGAGHEK